MELDLKQFGKLIPICALNDESLHYLTAFSRSEQFGPGAVFVNNTPEHPESIYLVAGEITLPQTDGPSVTITEGSNRALYALNSTDSKPPEMTVTEGSATLMFVDTHLLDKLLAWGELAPESSVAEEMELSKDRGVEESEWMMSMLSTAIFSRLPASNSRELFARMEEVRVNQGNVIIRKGEVGNFFYVIREGRCKVTLPSESGETVLAQLGKCSSFGEEALISDTPRNASVTMLTPGVLMRLSKSDFTELMKAPIMKWLGRKEIQPWLNRGARLIDVRFKHEFIKDGLPDALNIPLNMIRTSIPKLNKAATYILYCDNGQRSSVAAFLLIQNGFSVYTLKGGLGK